MVHLLDLLGLYAAGPLPLSPVSPATLGPGKMVTRRCENYNKVPSGFNHRERMFYTSWSNRSNNSRMLGNYKSCCLHAEIHIKGHYTICVYSSTQYYYIQQYQSTIHKLRHYVAVKRVKLTRPPWPLYFLFILSHFGALIQVAKP